MARTTRRAWNGGIKNIDELLSWLYSEGILNKGDREKKDSIFRQYYRYYNDGDAPRGVLRKYGLSKYQDSKIEEKLEEYLCDFISTILKKYQGKYSRQDFYVSRRLGKLNTLLNITESYDAYCLLSYWIKDAGTDTIRDGINQLRGSYETVRRLVDLKDPTLINKALPFVIDSEDVDEDVLISWNILKVKMINLAAKIKIEIVNVETQRDIEKIKA